MSATSPSLSVHLFGHLRVLICGEPMPPVRTRSVEWLLALLVLRHGRTVDRAWLAGTLWPESRETRARQNLCNDLVHLRKALGTENRRILSPSRNTLTLDLEGAEVDIVRFDAWIGAGDEQSLRGAVEVYAGPLLEGCYEEWVVTERDGRAAQYLDALEKLAEWAQESENVSEAIPLLRRIEAVDPLRDSTAQRLMTCLVAVGDPAAAIEVYRNLRIRLHEEIGAQPDSATTQLFHQIRAMARASAARSHPTPRLTPPAPVQEPKHSYRASVPAPLTHLIGRDQDVREVRELLRQNRLVTLIGGGGVGKTRLAIEAATLASADFASGAAWIELASLADGAFLPSTISAALGQREEEGASNAEALSARLDARFSGAPLLLVLDNCEHILEAVANVVHVLLQRCASLHVLATSRQRLGIAGEIGWRVPSLPAPESDELPSDLSRAIDTAMGSPAVRLFVERAAAVRTGFCLASRDDVDAVCHICRRLDGIPLALELAAARVRSLDPQQIAERLNDRFQLLNTGARGVLPRHRTLRALIDWSYDQLPPEERGLLRRLSVFAGGWTLDAAEAVCKSAGNGTAEVLDMLDSLADRSLILVDEYGNHLRYRMLETVREYALEKLRERAEDEEARDRHLDHYLCRANEISMEWDRPDPEPLLSRVEEEEGNFRAALLAAQRGSASPNASLHLAGALWRYWEMRSHLAEGREHLRAAMSRNPFSDSPEGAQVLLGAATLAFLQADLTAALDHGRQSESLFRSHGNLRGLAEALIVTGHSALESNRLEESSARLNEALELSKASGWERGVALSLIDLGLLATRQGLWDEARPLLDQGLAAAEEAGHVLTIGLALLGRGFLALQTDAYADSVALLERSLEIWRTLGLDHYASLTLRHMAQAAHRQGDAERSALYFEEVIAAFRKQGFQTHVGIALHEFGIALYEQGNFQHARQVYAESLSLLKQSDNGYGRSVRNRLGSTLFQLGDVDGAKALHLEALDLCVLNESAEGIVRSLERLAVTEARGGNPHKASRLLGAASRRREGLGRPLERLDQADWDRAVINLRETLGDAIYIRLWEEGRLFTHDQAVCEALGIE